jgi:hypothetical protein
MRHWIAAVSAFAAATLAPDPAHAGLVPVQVSVTPEGGMYRFTYAIVLPTDAQLRPGDYFTIYDFDGFVPGSASSSGSPFASDWTFSSAKTGPTPAMTEPTDNPAIDNLTWAYNGPVIGSQQTGLGNFWALSQYPDTTDSWFTASTGTSGGVRDNNITPTVVPVPTAPHPPAGVPEPSALVLAGLGLPLATLAFRRARGRAGFEVAK